MSEHRDGQESLSVDPEVLAVDPEQMRALGYRMVDLAVQHSQTLDDLAPMSERGADELIALLGGEHPNADPMDMHRDLELLGAVVLQSMQHADHPRYFARVPGPAAFPGILGDWIATGMQTMAASWAGGSGPIAAEILSLRWLAELLGLPARTEGVMLSGGSMANINALLVARNSFAPGVGEAGGIYCSDQTHSSIIRGIATMGADHVRILPTGADLVLEPASVRAAIERDRAQGIEPRIIVATAGTTNTGAVDPLEALADIAAEEGLWLHVDGAYGAPVAMTARGRRQLAGLERADSVVTDPHKWLFQPYDIGCLLVTRPGALEATFTMTPEYLADVTGGEVNLRDRSLELSRRGRGIKLWLTFRAFGTRALTAAVERGVALAEYAQSALEDDVRWEIATSAQLGIVTFSYSGATAEQQARAAALLTKDGYAALTTTKLHGRSVLRLCTINPATTTADIDGTIERLGSLLDTITAEDR